MKRKFYIITIIGLYIIIAACHGNYTPKPRGYFNINLPKKEYRPFTSKSCPFGFEYPVYANIVYDTSFFDTLPEHACWLNIEYPEFKGKIYLSYKVLDTKTKLSELVEDTYQLTSKHIVKAQSIEESIITTPYNVHGLLYEVSGDAASAIQFCLTDSTNHFVRCALYFSAPPNVDSLTPVIDFVRKDIMHMIKTFQWDVNLNVNDENPI